MRTAMLALVVVAVLCRGVVSAVPAHGAASPVGKPEDVADRVLNALAAAGLQASRVVLDKYIFPEPRGHRLPSVVYSWRTMGQETYSDGGVAVFRRFIDATVQSEAGAKLDTQLVMTMYIDRRVGLWRVFTIMSKKDFDGATDTAAGTGPVFSGSKPGDWYDVESLLGPYGDRAAPKRPYVPEGG